MPIECINNFSPMFMKHFKAQRYFEFTLLFKNPVRTSQETHYDSARDPNQLMLIGETAAVYCKSHTEHISTLCISVNTSHETHYISATEPNRLMLFREAVAVYCENHREHISTLCGHFSSYLTGNTLRLRYRIQPVDAVWGNSRCLLWELYRTHKYTV
jgi:hypothetical protein